MGRWPWRWRRQCMGRWWLLGRRRWSHQRIRRPSDRRLPRLFRGRRVAARSRRAGNREHRRGVARPAPEAPQPRRRVHLSDREEPPLMTTISTPTGPATQMPGAKAKPASKASLATTAFFAILRRDVVVTARDFLAFLAQTLLQPLFFLFIFGKVLPSIGLARAGFGSVLLPGIVALTTLTAALQGVTLPLVLDLGFAREIDDRLLAPLPISLVAVEKVVFAAMRGLVAGAIIFPLAAWILGSEFQVRTDRIAILVVILI